MDLVLVVLAAERRERAVLVAAGTKLSLCAKLMLIAIRKENK